MRRRILPNPTQILHERALSASPRPARSNLDSIRGRMAMIVVKIIKVLWRLFCRI